MTDQSEKRMASGVPGSTPSRKLFLSKTLKIPDQVEVVSDVVGNSGIEIRRWGCPRFFILKITNCYGEFVENRVRQYQYIL
ncbi:MAG: hypothetical protein MZV70_47800 [Desulfobacterales bacterium]|nr:hypothetical protein [Desulfobacterales bacterium]